MKSHDNRPLFLLLANALVTSLLFAVAWTGIIVIVYTNTTAFYQPWVVIGTIILFILTMVGVIYMLLRTAEALAVGDFSDGITLKERGEAMAAKHESVMARIRG